MKICISLGGTSLDFRNKNNLTPSYSQSSMDSNPTNHYKINSNDNLLACLYRPSHFKLALLWSLTFIVISAWALWFHQCFKTTGLLYLYLFIFRIKTVKQEKYTSHDHEISNI